MIRRLAARLAPFLGAMLLGALSLGALSAGCITPPLVLPGGLQLRDVSKLPYPPSSQPVDVEVAPGQFLHGVFVPADEGAPIVVHLLESSGSFTPSIYTKELDWGSMSIVIGGRQVTWQLADLGFASLIVDYSGVGPSDGERDPATLARDAEAIYDEALRRVGGNEECVVLRGTSIGCLAAAQLLDAGHRPAAVILIDPVRAETVAHNFTWAYHNAVVAALVAPWLRDGLDVDLERTLAGTSVPLLVIAARDDELLPADEQELLRAAVARAGGEWVTLEPQDAQLQQARFKVNDVSAFPQGDHFPLACSARKLFDVEPPLLGKVLSTRPSEPARIERLLTALDPELRERFPEGSPECAALRAAVAGRINDDATLLALTVLAGCTRDECRAYLDVARRNGDTQPVGLTCWVGARDREQCLQRLDLSDPAGRVPVDLVTALASNIEVYREPGAGPDAPWDLESLLAFARGAARPRDGRRAASRTTRDGTSRGTYWIPLDSTWTRMIHEQGLSESDACRLILRAFLKAAGIEERVVAGPDGARLEVREGEGWRAVDPLILLDADGA